MKLFIVNQGSTMPKGFGSLTPERRREISSAGGKAAHAAGTAHRFTVAEARVAGRIGGLKARKRGLAMAALDAASDAASNPVPDLVPVAPTEPPPAAPMTEPAPPMAVEAMTPEQAADELVREGQRLGMYDPPQGQSALDAVEANEIQRIHDEATARS
jgi:uncharacterized protein